MNWKITKLYKLQKNIAKLQNIFNLQLLFIIIAIRTAQNQ